MNIHTYIHTYTHTYIQCFLTGVSGFEFGGGCVPRGAAGGQQPPAEVM